MNVTDCKVGYCQDVTNRAKDRIEVEGGKISVKDLEVFQAKKRSRITDFMSQIET